MYIEDEIELIEPKFQIGDSVWFQQEDKTFKGLIENISPCRYNNIQYLYYTVLEEKSNQRILVENDFVIENIYSTVLLLEIYTPNTANSSVKELENFSFVIC